MSVCTIVKPTTNSQQLLTGMTSPREIGEVIIKGNCVLLATRTQNIVLGLRFLFSGQKAQK